MTKEEAAQEYAQKTSGGFKGTVMENLIAEIFIAGAEWQKEHNNMWINIEEGRPNYYRSVLIKYTDSFSRSKKAYAHMVSDGDNFYWIITGTDNIINDECVHSYKIID